MIDETDIPATLVEREKNYGSFQGQAFLAQSLKHVMQGSPKWAALSEDKKEALDQIASKLARILNGNAEYADSYVDIAGYATLIANNLTAIK